MRKIFGVLLTVILMLASVGSASAGGNKGSSEDKASVPVVSPVNSGLSAPAPSDVGTMACNNSVTGITKNPLPYLPWTHIVTFDACTKITVKVYNIGSANSVVVRILNSQGQEVSPRVKWDPGVHDGWINTWNVGPGTYTVEASAYSCCTSTSATFDVWTE